MSRCKASLAGAAFTLWSLSVSMPVNAQPESGAGWPLPSESQASTPRRYAPWAGQPSTQPQPERGATPSYRGDYGQRTWSNFSRAEEGFEDEFGRPEERAVRPEPPTPPSTFPGYARGPGSLWPTYPGALYGAPPLYGSGSGYYGSAPYTGLRSPYGHGPAYGSGGLNPWFWGW